MASTKASSLAGVAPWNPLRPNWGTSIRLRLLSGYALIVVLMALTTVVAAVSVLVMRSELLRQTTSLDTLATEIAQINTLMDDAETGTRGYVLTKNDAFLEPYTIAEARLPNIRNDVDQLARGEPGAPPLVAEMEQSGVAWENWARAFLLQSAKTPVGSAEFDTMMLAGKRLFDVYRAASQRVVDYVHLQSEQGLAQNQAVLIATLTVIVLFFVGTVGLVTFVGRRTTRAVIEPLERLRLATLSIGRGELAVPIEAETIEEFAPLAVAMDGMRRQLHLQRELAELVGSTLHIEDVYPQVAAGMRSLVPFDYLSVTVLADNATTVERVYAEGIGTDRSEARSSLPFVSTLVDEVIRSGSLVIVDDLVTTANDRREGIGWAIERGLRSAVFIPLAVKGRAIGTINLVSLTPGHFNATNVTPIVALAPLLAAAIENARLYRAIDQGNADLQRASQTKSEFLAKMSHELRTPLNAIIGFSEVLVDNTFGPLNNRQQRYVQNVLDAGRHLLGLVNDILDLSKVEAGRMELHREDLHLASLLIEIRQTMLALAEQKQIEIQMTQFEDPELSIQVDRARFVQVMYNLLSNAIKFTPTEGIVGISVNALPDKVAIAVHDTGIGIAPEDQERIFGEFQQVDSSAGRAQQGTGLGLTLTRRLVELHGGHLTVDSAVGQGSTFTFTVPRTPPKIGGTRGDVLVIEDDLAGWELLRLYLGEANYGTQWVSRAADALTMARAMQPVAITLDLLMDDGLSWAILAQLKADPLTRDIPVVIVSILDEQRVGFTLGASAYLVKPVARGVLQETLKRVTGDGGKILRILAVDDRPEALELVALALGGSHYELLRASSGVEALDILQKERPDALIVDLMMEPMSGFDLIATIAADPRWSSIPIVAMTAYDLSPADLARLNGYVVATLSKNGFNRERFLRELQRAVGPAFEATPHHDT